MPFFAKTGTGHMVSVLVFRRKSRMRGTLYIDVRMLWSIHSINKTLELQ